MEWIVSPQAARHPSAKSLRMCDLELRHATDYLVLSNGQDPQNCIRTLRPTYGRSVARMSQRSPTIAEPSVQAIAKVGSGREAFYDLAVRRGAT